MKHHRLSPDVDNVAAIISLNPFYEVIVSGRVIPIVEFVHFDSPRGYVLQL